MADTKNSSALQSFLATPDPPELGPGPRSPVQPAASVNRQFDAAFAQAGLTGEQAALTRAAILLWHDHLDAAHAIVQDLETRDGSYVHAILHRREPDYGNAKYWFRRVGTHPCFAPLALRAMQILKTSGDNVLTNTLLPRGQWDAFAFVDECQAAACRSSAEPRNVILRNIQRIEFEVLLGYLGSQAS